MRDEAQQARVDECPACKGTGHAFDIRPDGEPESTGPCPRCYGDGADTCPTCGSGDRFIVRGLCASDTHDHYDEITARTEVTPLDYAPVCAVMEAAS